MTPKQKLLAYAQLLRLPNVFTAFADICMAGAASGFAAGRPAAFAAILGCSGCLYLAGMVFNDWFDQSGDARTQPYRPIPSGRISAQTALLIGSCLFMVGGVLSAAASGPAWLFPDKGLSPPAVAGTLMLAILLYNGWLKRTPIGPAGMGFCRFLNVWLGLSVAGDARPNDGLGLHLAAAIGVYIVGVTWFARTEEATSNRRQLVAAAAVMATALGLAVTVPAHLPEGASPWYYPFLVVGFGFTIGTPIVAAIRRPEPKPVQAAVKRCILGLVVLDAVLATAFVGLPGLLILLLLPPALLLGKWVYST